MTTATPLLLENTVQDFTTYKAGIDGNSKVQENYAWGFTAHENTDSVGDPAPDMTVQLEPGTLHFPINAVQHIRQNTGTIVAPSVNPRIDLVVISRVTGDVEVITGAEDASPVPPQLTAGRIPIAEIALATSTTTIGNSLITDRRPAMVSGGIFDIKRVGGTSENVSSDDHGVCYVIAPPSAGMTLNLPEDPEDGFIFTMKNPVGGTASLVPTGSIDTIEGNASDDIGAQWANRIYIYDKTDNVWLAFSAAPFASGVTMLFGDTAAPVGWTKSVTHDNKALRVVTGTVSSGGADTFTTVFGSGTHRATDSFTLTSTEMPNHNHVEREAVSGSGLGIAGNSLNVPSNSDITTGGAGSSGSHSHNIDNIDLQFVDVIIAVKD